MIYPLAADSVYWTLQGEGALSGTPMAFVRLAGCSIGCPQCDTDYKVRMRVETDALVGMVLDVTPKVFNYPWVWITGGEPTDHDLAPLVALLQDKGYRVALATSGKRLIGRLPVQWISVSPHVATIAQTHGHELKVVPGLNGLTWDDVRELSRLSFPYRWIQPMSGRYDGTDLYPKAQAEAIAFVLQNPGWQLSFQAHKAWNLR